MSEQSYNIYFGWNNLAEKMILPVMPERLEIKRKGAGKTYEIVGLGQINSIQSRELAEISFESFFPAVERYRPAFTSSALLGAVEKGEWQFRTPRWHVENICRWQDSKRPIRFIYTMSNDYSINLAMSIEQFDRWEEAGSEGDIGYRITLKEYVFHAPRKVTVATGTDGKQVLRMEPPKRPDDRVRPDTVVVKPGEKLFDIARRWYDGSNRSRDIVKLNNLTAEQQKNLPVGMVLRLPKN